MGRLTKDPELRYTTKSNTAVASFTLSINRRFAQQGQPQADFINIIAWNKTAEFAAKYFIKGQQVAVVGRIQNRTWDDSEGKRHYITEVVADETYFADSKRNSEPGGSSQKANAQGGNMNDGFYPMDEEDDLPF